MENDFFLNAGVQPPLHLESATSMPTWHALSAQPTSEFNWLSDRSPDCFYNPCSWDNKSTDQQGMHFDSALNSMVSSPVASNSNLSNENFVIRELIGKLGNIGGNSGEISPHRSQALLGSAATIPASSNYVNGTGTSSTNNSCYSTPLNSPPKLNLPIMDYHHRQLVKEKLPTLGKSMPLNSSVAEFSADPGFAERAARFSCFGSRSFNGRTSQFGGLNNNAEPLVPSSARSNSLVGDGKLPRVSSSPALKAPGSQMGVQESKNSPLQDRTGLANSQEESTVSELQNPHGETRANATNESNSRKRKPSSKGKSKEPVSSPSVNATKVNYTNNLQEKPSNFWVCILVPCILSCRPKRINFVSSQGADQNNDNSNAKRCKPNEGNENGGPVKAEEEATGSAGDEKQNKPSPKPPEPPKDYIHVRARRGQATDSHSLAERVKLPCYLCVII